jgi:glyoxylate/hydroxypyruvate reductase
MTMAVLLTAFFGNPEEWRRLFAAQMPELDVRIWPDVGDERDIDVAAIAVLPHGKLKSFPNLRMIVSLLAGADVLLSDPSLPDIPIVRAGNPGGDEMMNEAALVHVLRHHRHLPAYMLAQQRAEWISLPRLRASERTVGVLGLGTIGLAVAKTLAAHGFKIAGWVRTPRPHGEIEIFSGREQLPAFLARSEIIVNLLPLTGETRGILNSEFFALLSKGASVINLGRGGHVVETDLLAALDRDQLAGATLDVFPVEPLPKDSPLWRHPKITITPHVARGIYATDLVPRICDAIWDLKAGRTLKNQIDRARGY